MGSQPRGCLARFQPQNPADDDELFRLAQAAWRGQGIATIRLAEIHNEWEHQIVENIANRIYGKRAVDN